VKCTGGAGTRVTVLVELRQLCPFCPLLFVFEAALASLS
jgi:hypothetical protein